MKNLRLTTSCSKRLVSFLLVALFLVAVVNAQTKRIKRPNSKVGVASVDRFVQESFDLYDKVYMYDGYAKAGTPLEDNDLDVLTDALEDVQGLSESAIDIVPDIDGIGILKQGKATLQISRAKKALAYSVKTTKELLLGSGQKEDADTNDDTSTSNEGEENSSNQEASNNQNTEESTVPENISDNLEVYSKFDYVPGDQLLFYDDFSNDFIGDFPSKWNTNGSGELIKINDDSNKWLKLISGSNTQYIPDLTNLPEEFTLEFDIQTKGLTKKTSSQSYFKIAIASNTNFDKPKDFASIEIPLCQFIALGIIVENNVNGKREIRNTIKVDLRNQVTKLNHISIAVNKQRIRLWVNENKYVDVPRLLPASVEMQSIKLNLRGLDINKEDVFVSNFKIAKGGVDLRRKLLSEGKISTNGILFDSGSANIKPQSFGIIRQISQVLEQDSSINLNIIGHTDADGPDDTNLKLSKDRAAAVRQALIDTYKISGDRLQTDGKGESEPVDDNATANGKAQNRRVEFVKM